MKMSYFLITFLSISILSNISLAKDSDVLTKIERDYKYNKIDYSTALEYKVYSIYNDSRLPDIYKSRLITPKKCATPIMDELIRNWAELSSQSQNRLNTFFDNKKAMLTETYISPEGYFNIHYSLTGKDAIDSTDADGSGIPDHIESAGEILDYVWYMEIDSLGFKKPQVGYNNMMEVYFEDMDYYGYVQGQDNLHLNNDYSDFPGTPLGCLQVTAAHEFHHEIQYEYMVKSIWYKEISSTHMEDIVYDDINDYLNYLPTWYSSPWISITQFDGAHEYASCIWNHYLAEKFGENIIKEIWSYRHTMAITAITKVLEGYNTTLEQEFAEFEVWNYFTGFRSDDGPVTFSEANLFPTVMIQNTHNITSEVIKIENESPDSLKYPNILSANYIKCQNVNSEGYFNLTITGDETTDWAGKIITENINGDVEINDIIFNGNIGEYQLVNWFEMENVIIVPTNISTLGSEPSAYSYSITILDNFVTLEDHNFYELSGNMDGDFLAGDTIGLNVSFKNYNTSLDSTSYILSSNNPDVEIVNDSIYIGQLNQDSTKTNIPPFTIFLKDSIKTQNLLFTIDVKSNDSLITTNTLECKVGFAPILLINDSDNSLTNETLSNALGSLNLIYKEVNVTQDGLENLQMTSRNTVIWSIDGKSFTPETIDSLEKIFNSSTNLILFGQNLGENLHNEIWCPFDTVEATGGSWFKGVDNDILGKSNQNWIWVMQENQETPELIQPIDPRSHVSFAYLNTNFGGIIRHSENGRFVAIDFPISSINPITNDFLSIDSLIHNIFDFIDNENTPPSGFSLNSNFADSIIVINNESEDLIFEWNNSTDNEDISYTFYINDNDDHRSYLYNQSGIDTNFINISALELINSLDLTSDTTEFIWGVFASDGKEVTICDSSGVFSISSIIVNSPPETFSLLLPENSDTFFVSLEMSRAFTFLWNQSVDPELDSLFYCLEFYNEGDTINRFYTADTFFSFIPSELLSIIDTSGTLDISWSVKVSDNDSTTYSDSLRSLTLVDLSSVAIDDLTLLPSEFFIDQNFPNPFNPITRINYGIPKKTHLEIAVYDLVGKRIRTLSNGLHFPGFYSVHWDAKSSSGEKVPSGIYFYKIQSDDFIQIKKCVLVK